MKVLGSTKKDVDKDKDGQDIPKLETVEVVLVHCNLINSSFSQHPKYSLLWCLIINLAS